jgi:predicted dinucleotide-utilizing enzyme
VKGRHIGLIGAGAIGGTVLQACAAGEIACRRVTVLLRRLRPDVERTVSTPHTVHEIIGRGGFGGFTLRFENATDPANPRTARLAGLSAVAALQTPSCTLRLA